MKRRKFITTSSIVGLGGLSGCLDVFHSPDDSPMVELYGDVFLELSGKVQDGDEPHPLIGNPDAEYAVHYFTDPQCGFCFRWEATKLPEVYEEY